MSGIAVVGASESGTWTLWLLRNLAACGCRGDIWPINRGRKEVFGKICLPALDQGCGGVVADVLIPRPAANKAAGPY